MIYINNLPNTCSTYELTGLEHCNNTIKIKDTLNCDENDIGSASLYNITNASCVIYNTNRLKIKRELVKLGFKHYNTYTNRHTKLKVYQLCLNMTNRNRKKIFNIGSDNHE